MTKLYILLAVFLAGVLSGSVATRKIDNGRFYKLKSDYAQAEVLAAKKAWDQQHAADAVTAQAVEARALSSEKLASALQKRLAKVEIHEKDLMRGCVTYEFVRQLRAYIRAESDDALALPAGKSPRDCAPISGLRLERRIIENLAIGRDAGDRFNKLSAWARSIEAMRPK